MVGAAWQTTSTVRACRRHSAPGGPAGHRRWAAIRDHLGHAPAIPSAWRVRASAPATPAAPAGPYHGRGMVVRWSPPGRGHTGGTGPPLERAGRLATGDAHRGEP